MISCNQSFDSSHVISGVNFNNCVFFVLLMYFMHCIFNIPLYYDVYILFPFVALADAFEVIDGCLNDMLISNMV